MKIDHASFILDKNSADNKFYVKKGDEDYIDSDNFYRSETESDRVCAKAVKNKLVKSFRDTSGKKDYSFFIKTTPDKEVYNPFQKFTIEKTVKKNYINKVCKSDTVFTQVPQTVFQKYLKFLSSGSIKSLQDIQREIR